MVGIGPPTLFFFETLLAILGLLQLHIQFTLEQQGSWECQPLPSRKSTDHLVT